MEYIKLIMYILFFVLVFSFFSLAPWVPTSKKDLNRIYKIVWLEDGEKFLEIWCGTSVVSLYMAKNKPNSFIVGIELSPVLYIISKIKIFFSWYKNIKIIYGNALKINLAEYNVLYVFGLPDTISNKLFPKILNIDKNNFRLISYCFKMTNNKFIEKKHKIAMRNSIYEYSLNTMNKKNKWI